MDQLIPSLVVLVEPFAVAFRKEAFDMFRLMVGAWVVCLGRRTISRVWETTGQSEARNHAAAFRLFSEAAWNWDEVCRILICAIVAHLVPGMRIWVVVDDTLCHKRGAKVAFGGIFLDAVLSTKIRWDAALTTPLSPETTSRRKKGQRLPTPAQILADDGRWPAEDREIDFPKGKRRLRVKVVRDVCWYQAAGPQSVQLILVRDPQGQWRDEALLSTDLSLSAEEIITGYCRRWSVEVAFCDSKQMLGFHDPQVWCAHSVQRAAPMSWFIGSLVVLWYVLSGQNSQQAKAASPLVSEQAGAHLCRHVGHLSIPPLAALAQPRTCLSCGHGVKMGMAAGVRSHFDLATSRRSRVSR